MVEEEASRLGLKVKVVEGCGVWGPLEEADHNPWGSWMAARFPSAGRGRWC